MPGMLVPVVPAWVLVGCSGDAESPSTTPLVPASASTAAAPTSVLATPSPVPSTAAPLAPTPDSQNAPAHVVEDADEPADGELLCDALGPDRNCSDFDAWQKAQDFFPAAGGPGEDRHGLDSDGNGSARESLVGGSEETMCWRLPPSPRPSLAGWG